MLNRMLRHVRYRYVGVIAAYAIAIASAQAAEITVDDYYGVQFEGKIEKGDYEKLFAAAGEIASEMYNNPNRSIYPVLHLFSPGGDLAEAMKIGRLVRQLHWMTTAPENLPNGLKDVQKHTMDQLKNSQENYMCASACFFIFVAGTERWVGYRNHHDDIILGIHRPYLSDIDLKRMSSKDAMSTAANTHSVVENYLREMNVPAKYADLMFSIPKDNIQWLNPTDIKPDLGGFIPELSDWVDARCDNRTDIEKMTARSLEAKMDRIRHEMEEIKKTGRLEELETFSPDEDRIREMLENKDDQRGECERKLRVELSKQGNKEVWGR